MKCPGWPHAQNGCPLQDSRTPDRQPSTTLQFSSQSPGTEPDAVMGVQGWGPHHARVWRSMLERHMSCGDNARAGQEGTKSPFWAVRGEGTSCAQQRRGQGCSCRVGAGQGRTLPLPAGGCLCAHFMHNRSSEERDTVSLLQIQFQLDE